MLRLAATGGCGSGGGRIHFHDLLPLLVSWGIVEAPITPHFVDTADG